MSLSVAISNLRPFILIYGFIFSLSLFSESKPGGQDKASNKSTANNTELIKRIKSTLAFGNATQAKDALTTLGRLSPAEQKSLLPDLKKLAKSNDPTIQKKLSEFIGQVEWNELDEELLRYFSNKENDQVFYAALIAMGKKKPVGALPLILKEIREQDFTKPGNKLGDVIGLLIIYKDNSIEPFLLEKLSKNETYLDFRNSILKFLGESGPMSPAARTLCEKILTDVGEPLITRGYAAYAFGRSNTESARGPMKEQLKKIDAMKNSDEKKRYTRFRMQIIAALIRLKDNDVKDILLQMVKDDDESVRIRAISQLSQLNLPEARELLEFKAKYDPSIKVQREARKALKLLKGEAAKQDDDEEDESEESPQDEK